jgi:hypothetical protein
MKGHPEDLDLLRAADRIVPAEAADHVEQCEECRTRVAEARSFGSLARSAYGEPAREVPSATLERRMAEADRRAVAPSLLRRRGRPLLAAAALLLAGVTIVLTSGGPVEIRSCAIVADRPTAVRDPLHPITSARSGEPYRVEFVLEDSGHVALFNLDTSGALHLFYPFRREGDRLDRFGLDEPLARGNRIQIPPAGTHEPFRLDDVPGTEWFFLVASSGPIDDRTLLEVLGGVAQLPRAERTSEAVSRGLAQRFGTVRSFPLEHLP